MNLNMLSIDDLPRQNASQVKNKWGEVVRLVQETGTVAVTNHSTVEMVLVDVQTYTEMQQTLQAFQSREQAALDSLTERFKNRLASLQEPAAHEKLAALMQSRGKLSDTDRPTAGSSF